MASVSMSTTTTQPAEDGSKHLPHSPLIAILQERFGIDRGEVLPLGGEIDQNSKVFDAVGNPWFVRVTRIEASVDDVTWQNSLLRHIAETMPDIPVPRLVQTKDGSEQVELEYGGNIYLVRVMTWLPGRVLAEINHHPPDLLRDLGRLAGRLCLGLSDLNEPTRLTHHDWDMLRANATIEASLPHVRDSADLQTVQEIMSWYSSIRSTLDKLPQGVVHQDLNDANILADLDSSGTPQISGIVDFGDALYSIRVAELAVAVAYAMLRKDDPLSAATEVVAGFHSELPLTPEEMAVIFPLAATRLCMNAVIWNKRVAESGSKYGVTRSQHTWPTIRQISKIPPSLAEAAFRSACSTPGTVNTCGFRAITSALSEQFRGSLHLDLRPASDFYDELDWHNLEAVRLRTQDKIHDRTAILGHLESSLMWSQRRAPGVKEPATVRLGTTFATRAGYPVEVPADAVIEQVIPNDQFVVLRHTEQGRDYFTCWWNVLTAHSVGDHVRQGDSLGDVAEGEVEPGLGPGFQIQLHEHSDIACCPPPRRISASERKMWSLVTVDPVPGLNTDAEPELDLEEVLSVRERHIARSQRHYYQQPMNLIRGRDVWLYDEHGRAYLDSLNNVTHVGHAEPRVTAAATRQMRKLNTNSRFVYPQIAAYAEKLVSTLPAPLEVVFLVCSGSEANDLAIRIARQVTDREHLVNIDGAYHGNTGVVTGISPNRYKGPGGQGVPATTHEVLIPDRYRGAYGYGDPAAGEKYAGEASNVIERISADGRRPAAFIAESLMGTAGNIVLPDNYLSLAFGAARTAGALCISDEVQVGVGRLGPWWGFELQGVVPDIVTMGKPIGNGHPLAAVVTTREIADAFDTGMKYFNTFGGNPISCAIGSSVLDIVENDGLRENATQVGTYFADCLEALQTKHLIIGDVRAQGLYLGVELVRNRETREPASQAAFIVTELAKERGLVVFPNGVHDNVLKIKPPMTFQREHVDIYIDVLDEILSRQELKCQILD